MKGNEEKDDDGEKVNNLSQASSYLLTHRLLLYESLMLVKIGSCSQSLGKKYIMEHQGVGVMDKSLCVSV